MEVDRQVFTLFQQIGVMPQTQQREFVLRQAWDQSIKDKLLRLIDLQEKETSKSDPETLPNKIGKFKLGRRLGRGGSGSVFEGFDTVLERKVAIKMLNSEVPYQQELIEKEAKVLSQLNHKNICQIYEVVVDQGRFYLILEYLEGASLAETDLSGFSPKQKWVLAYEIAEALVATHKMNLFHGDLKPENIFLTRDGHIKILDFGLAGHVQKSSGKILGTPAYMSPEQAFGEILTNATDVFSFGLFMMALFGERLPRIGQNLEKTLAQAMNAQFDAQNLPPRVRKIAEKMTRPLPANRPSMAEVRAMIRQQIERPRRRLLQGLVAAVVVSAITTATFFGWSNYRIEKAWKSAEKQAQNSEAMSNFLVRMFEEIGPEKPDQKNLTAYELLNESVGRIEGDLSQQPEVRYKLYCAFTRVFTVHGRWELALANGNAAIEIAHQVFGEQSIEAGESHYLLGNVYWQMGDMQLGETHYRRSLRVLDQLADDQMRAEVTHALGRLFLYTEQFDDALTYLKQAHRLKIAKDPKPNVELAKSHLDLGSLHRRQGNFSLAIQEVEKARDMFSDVLGPDHIKVALAWNNLALVHYLNGDYDLAQKGYQACFDLASEIYGESHPNIAQLNLNLGRFYITMGRLDSATEHIEKAYTARKKHFSDDHQYVHETLQWLSYCQLKGGKRSSAFEAYVNGPWFFRHEPAKPRIMDLHLQALNAQEPLTSLAFLDQALDLAKADESLTQERLEIHLARFRLFTQMGWLAFAGEEWQQIMGLTDQLSDQNPLRMKAQLEGSRGFLALGNLNKAETMARDLLERAPQTELYSHFHREAKVMLDALHFETRCAIDSADVAI